jgi:toxin ParE1/3/4
LGFQVEFSAEAEHDLNLILDFLVEQYVGFGEAPADALDRAADRVRGIRADAERLAKAPYRGTPHDDILPGVRHATIGKAIFWFDLHESAATVTVLGVFFRGQEHRIAMLRRLLED